MADQKRIEAIPGEHLDMVLNAVQQQAFESDGSQIYGAVAGVIPRNLYPEEADELYLRLHERLINSQESLNTYTMRYHTVFKTLSAIIIASELRDDHVSSDSIIASLKMGRMSERIQASILSRQLRHDRTRHKPNNPLQTY